MTYEEAKRYILENWFDVDQDVKAVVFGDEETMALKMAVEAIEKQIPKKTRKENAWCCPTCGYMACFRSISRCRECGQLLDWGDTE